MANRETKELKSKVLSLMFVTVVLIVASATGVWSQTGIQEDVSLSDSIGTEIDKTEREAYRLFPDIQGFRSARILRVSDSKYRLNYTFEDLSGVQQKSRTISSEAFELTKTHVELIEKYHRIRSSRGTDQNLKAEFIYELALKYASRTEYDVALKLLGTLVSEYPESRQALEAKTFYADAQRLSKSKKALLWKGSLFDQNGRTELLIFSGYYGLWLGVATPIFLGADSPQAYALGLLLGGPLSLFITHKATKEANISDGRAAMISLSGHLGLWQGLGWAAIADMEGHEVVGVGELCGLAGIGAATLLTSKVDFETGHAELTSSGLPWGAWFGIVVGTIADHEDDELLRDMLIGSDILILGTAIATKNIQMSKTRVRLINLAGVLGTVVGFGIDLLVEVDEASTALGIAGMGSMIGAVVGTNLTKHIDQDKELSSLDDGELNPGSSMHNERRRLMSPHFTLQRDGDRLVPTIGFQFVF